MKSFQMGQKHQNLGKSCDSLTSTAFVLPTNIIKLLSGIPLFCKSGEIAAGCARPKQKKLLMALSILPLAPVPEKRKRVFSSRTPIFHAIPGADAFGKRRASFAGCPRRKERALIRKRAGVNHVP